MVVAVVGCTGLVGTVMLKLLEERKFPVTKLLAVASEKSVGKTVTFLGSKIEVISVKHAITQKPDLALFSAGAQTSLKYAPLFKQAGAVVIDNSSAWRMHPDIKLIVPEVNGHSLTASDKIIANPNCSTIQLVVALNLLHRRYHLVRLVISTYQSVTGTGSAAVKQLNNERNSIQAEKIYPYQIDLNVIPQVDVFLENGYTKEELKLVNETRKIFDHPSLRITATAVRLPVTGGHSESVNAEFREKPSLDEVRHLLAETPGVVLQDDPSHLHYPMPLFVSGSDNVFVGRIRSDDSCENAINLWIVSDNLRKGAATNAIQIAEELLAAGLLPAHKPNTLETNFSESAKL